jgi:hypothetical protein
MHWDTAEQRSVQWLSLPPRERILDRMSDLLLCAEDILVEVRAGAPSTPDAGDIRAVIERVFAEVNSLMKQLSD